MHTLLDIAVHGVAFCALLLLAFASACHAQDRRAERRLADVRRERRL